MTQHASMHIPPPSDDIRTAPAPSPRTVRYLLRHVGRFKGFLVEASVMIMIMGVVNLPLPLLNLVVINTIIPSGEHLDLILIGLFAFAVRAMASGFQVFQNFLIRIVTSGVGHNVRNEMVAAMLHAPYEQFVSGQISSHVGRLSNDVHKVEGLFFDSVRFVIRPLSMVLMMLAVMSLINVPATILLVLISPVTVYLTRRFQRDLREMQRQVLRQRQALQQEVTEVLDNVRVIRAFTREDRFQHRVENSIAQYTNFSVRHATRQSLTRQVIDAILLLPWLIMVVAGGLLIQAGQMDLGQFMAFIVFEQLIRSPLGQLSYYLLHIRADMVSAERAQNVADLPSDQRPGPDLPSVKGRIEFDDVSFGYVPGILVLNRFNLRIEPGQRIAVVGASGAGKSTLLNLLLGFYHPQGGRILIDGQDVSEVRTASIRQSIGVVFQDNPMFDATIRWNLTLGRENVSDETIYEALRLANADDFVRDLPQGLDTLIGVKGLKLSGGQRQRLAIARVILKDPSIIVLDEATSSLDSVSETQIQSALERLLSNRTSLTIAHRLSTIVRSDRILYLEKGQIIEDGPHRKLLAQNGRYAELFKTQIDGLIP